MLCDPAAKSEPADLVYDSVSPSIKQEPMVSPGSCGCCKCREKNICEEWCTSWGKIYHFLSFFFFPSGNNICLCQSNPYTPGPRQHIIISLGGLCYPASGGGRAEQGCQQMPEIPKVPYQEFSGWAVERKRNHIEKSRTFSSTALWMKVDMG